MPAARAASAREAPSSTSARASIRRAARASRHRAASRRSATAPGSFRVTATVMAPPPIGYTADQRPPAARGAARPTVRSRGRWYDPLGREAALQPEPVVARLVADDDLRITTAARLPLARSQAAEQGQQLRDVAAAQPVRRGLAARRAL